MKLADNEKYKFSKKVFIVAIGKCAGCFYCINACEEHAIKECVPPVVDHSLCTRCLKCVEICPLKIMQIVD